MKTPHTFKHRHPHISPWNPYTATGFISYKVTLRGERYGEFREYTKDEACMLPSMMRMMVYSKNEVCSYIMSLTDEEFEEHVRKTRINNKYW